MAKNNGKIFEIFLQSIGLYFTNIDRFVWYMVFPVVGQLLAFILTSLIVYSFIEYKSFILSSFPLLKTPLYMNITLSIVLIPVVFIWLKSVWDYFVAYSAVNSMTENMLKSERVYDFPAHTMMVTRRWFPYLCLCFMYFSLIFLSAIPVFLVFAWILLIYYAFVFQIFMFEPDLSPFDCFKQSSAYVKGNFKQTSLMIIMVGTLTYIIIPQIILTFLDTVKAVKYLQDLVQPLISVPSLDWLNMVLSAAGISQIMPAQVALFIVQFLTVIIVIQMLLPLRVISMCLWYKNFHNDSGAMKKIDDAILDRAGVNKKRRK